MKNSLEIVLRTIHRGSARRVVTLELDGNAPADDFLTKIKRSNSAGFDSLRARIRAVSDHDRYENKLTFRSLGGGLYEFKTKKTGIRLFAFYDEIEGQEPQLVIVTSGVSKSKRQDVAIQKARELKTEYLRRKALPETEIKIVELDP
ncbi:MAG: hypothetical protein KDM91_22975 [Verrucomicrobiae bacterium]|nr:hypothetical protein [Verrucomicrobiae bacterium]